MDRRRRWRRRSSTAIRPTCFLRRTIAFPEKIVAADLADTSEPIPYARGTLVLWARKDSPLQPLTQNTLRDGKFASLAIANPDHAPYGRAAVAALTWMKLYDTVKPKIVQAENIAQTAQFVESGNAQLGLISLTSASTPHMQEIGTFVRVPPEAYPEIRQCAVVMKKSRTQRRCARVSGLAALAGGPAGPAEVWARSGSSNGRIGLAAFRVDINLAN